MTPLHFESEYGPLWSELEAALDRIERRPVRAPGDPGAAPPGRRGFRRAGGGAPVDAARLASLYRRSCEHLALARARAYPIHLVDRLEALTQRAHQAIYRRQVYGWSGLWRILRVDFPRAVQLHRTYMAVAAAAFVLPLLVMGWLCYTDPGFALTVMDAEQLRNFESMYGDGEQALGRRRSAEGDWEMFGFYIMNNISVGFQCFAGGIFVALGSLFYLVVNGLLAGAAAGYLTQRGFGEAFYSFVATHAAFELTAIVIAGAAGLRIGYALLAPGRRTRLQAMRHAASEAVVLIYGMVTMLVVAAAVEAFWSSARWIPPEVKYGVALACWGLVFVYLGWRGRPGPRAPSGGSGDAG